MNSDLEQRGPIVVVGGGAIGLLVTASMVRAGLNVILAVRRTEQRAVITREGITAETPSDRWFVNPKVVVVEDLEQPVNPDILLLCVKSAQTQDALSQWSGHLKSDTAVVSCQNGLNNDMVVRLVGSRRAFAAVMSCPCVVTGVDFVRCHVKDPQFNVGPIVARDACRRASEIASIFGPPIKGVESTDILSDQWSKLARNCAINACLAVSGLTLRELADSPDGRRVFGLLASETLSVARLKGIEPAPIFGLEVNAWVNRDFQRIDDAICRAARRTPDGRSSMSADLAAGRATEVDHLNGAVASAALRVNANAPVNAAIVDLVHRAETGSILGPPELWRKLLSAADHVDENSS